MDRTGGARMTHRSALIISMLLVVGFSGAARNVSADTVDGLLARTHWLASTHQYGSACVMFDGPPVVYIDPAALPEPEHRIKADIILVTHGHSDHFAPDVISALAKPQTSVVTIPACVSTLREMKCCRGMKILEIRPGKRLTVSGVEIEAVPAYNLNGGAHPRSAGGVGYVVTLNGLRIYHSGDTSATDEMRSLSDIDVALLTLRPIYMMSGSEIVEAVSAFRPKVLIPIHWLDAERPEIEHLKQHISKSTRLVLLDAE
jgi:L-ascorbate metabolism protein UlaG (beta-lactamase superfamily)